MKSLSEIINALRQLSDQTIPQLRSKHDQLNKTLVEKYIPIANLSVPATLVNTPTYIQSYLLFMKAIFDARDSIYDTYQLCEQIASLAYSMLSIKTRSAKNKEIINAQADLCENIISELTVFTNKVTEELKKFGRICKENGYFKETFRLMMLNQIHDDGFHTWCDYWMDLKGLRSYKDPLSVAVKLIQSHPIPAPQHPAIRVQ